MRILLRIVSLNAQTTCKCSIWFVPQIIPHYCHHILWAIRQWFATARQPAGRGKSKSIEFRNTKCVVPYLKMAGQPGRSLRRLKVDGVSCSTCIRSPPRRARLLTSLFPSESIIRRRMQDAFSLSRKGRSGCQWGVFFFFERAAPGLSASAHQAQSSASQRTEIDAS